MSKRIETTVKEHYAQLEESLINDPHLNPLDFRILAFALCTAMGKRVTDRIEKFNASRIARKWGMKRDTIAASLERLVGRGFLVVLTQDKGKATKYGLRLDMSRDRVPTCPEIGYTSATAEAEENIKNIYPSTGPDHSRDSFLSSTSRSAFDESMARPKIGEVGSGIAGDRTEVWAREHLNNLGGYYYEGYEPAYRALIGPRGVQGFIDAVYLYGLRLDRGTQFKKPPEAWLRTAIQDGYTLSKGDRDTIAAEQLATEIPF